MQFRLNAFLFTVLSVFLFSGCGNTDPVFPLEPFIEFVSITPTQSKEGITDGIVLTIRFEDGDGDIGSFTTGDQTSNLFVVDARTNVPDSLGTFNYTIPNLTPDTRRPSIQGTINITMDVPFLTKNFIPPYIGPSEEGVSFNIHIIDRAGNNSNVILTEPILISE